MKTRISLTVPATLQFSAGVREFALEASEIAGFSKRDKNMFRLTVDELFMNAIRYGSDEKSSVEVSFVVDDDTISCSIKDEGKGAQKTSSDELQGIIQGEKDNTSLQKTHGRGLAQITSLLSSSFTVADRPEGGLDLSFEQKKSPPVEEVPTQTISSVVTPSSGEMATITFSINGEIDLGNLEEKTKEIDDFFSQYTTPHHVVFDFSELQYFNSTFIAKLAEWYSISTEKSGVISLEGVSDEVFEILDLVGFGSLLSIQRKSDAVPSPELSHEKN